MSLPFRRLLLRHDFVTKGDDRFLGQLTANRGLNHVRRVRSWTPMAADRAARRTSQAGYFSRVCYTVSSTIGLRPKPGTDTSQSNHARSASAPSARSTTHAYALANPSGLAKRWQPRSPLPQEDFLSPASDLQRMETTPLPRFSNSLAFLIL